ncbi:MAG: ATPase, T2SS/T4P/T4SS family, partial [Lachnospiraceae bacterium]|nr:ATPase, T2SS/T4P/T4SS family [Lachnospiraceae bacterium]
MNSYLKCKEKLKEKVIEKIDLSRVCEDEEVREIIDGIILEESALYYISLSEKRKLSRELFHSIRRLDILQELIDDSTITEIMVNGTEEIFVEKSGKLVRWDDNFRSKEKLEDVIQQIVAKCNRVVNESSPIVDARLTNGSRVN